MAAQLPARPGRLQCFLTKNAASAAIAPRVCPPRQDIPCSDLAKDLMSKLLTSDTAKRLTAAEALEHPWLQGQASKTPFLKTVVNNLRDFTASSKFKTGILKIMAETMSDKELADLRAVFQELDEDGNGQVTVTELSKAMEKSVEIGMRAACARIVTASEGNDRGGPGLALSPGWPSHQFFFVVVVFLSFSTGLALLRARRSCWRCSRPQISTESVQRHRAYSTAAPKPLRPSSHFVFFVFLFSPLFLFPRMFLVFPLLGRHPFVRRASAHVRGSQDQRQGGADVGGVRQGESPRHSAARRNPQFCSVAARQQRWWPGSRARCSLLHLCAPCCHRCCCGCAQIDSNKDGRLSVAEIQQALGADANEVQQMIAEVDSDGDGQVDFDEFITLWSMRSENDSAAAAAAAKKA